MSTLSAAPLSHSAPVEGVRWLWEPYLARGKLARPWQTDERTSREDTDEFGKTLYAVTEEADRKVVERLGKVAAARGSS